MNYRQQEIRERLAYLRCSCGTRRVWWKVPTFDCTQDRMVANEVLICPKCERLGQAEASHDA